MKIYTIEVDTDLGRRVLQLSPPIDVDPTGEMPAHFRSLTTDVLWGAIKQIAIHGPELTAAAHKVEA
jgi:hypothetical protein